MLGGTEYVAEACEEILTNLGHETNLHLKPDFSTITAQTFSEKTHKNKIWLVCTSTHGAGDYPDNIRSFIAELQNCDQDLSTVNFFTIGIGDSSYDTFCKAATDISYLLKTKGCNEILDVKKLDMAQEIDPEDLAQQWITQHSDLIMI